MVFRYHQCQRIWEQVLAVEFNGDETEHKKEYQPERDLPEHFLMLP
jgi:hypothetical protein